MEYRKLGRSGLKVSELSYGSWFTFGTKLDIDGVRACIREAYSHGINFFDNAEVYEKGVSELLMGEVLRDYPREQIVVSTKIFWGGDGPNDTGTNWKHLVEGTKNCLKRLQMDYVDLLYAHRHDQDTPVEEVVRAMDHLIRSGHAFYWGTSEWPAERIAEAYQIAEEHHLTPPTMEQPEYNILNRHKVEQEFAPLYERYGLGLTTFSPLASGMLTGKYNKGIPEGSRLSQHQWLRERLTEDILTKTRKLSDLAESVGCKMAQLGIAWCLQNPHVSTVLVGASSMQQLKENLSALSARDRLSPGVMEQIREIVGTPQPAMW